MKTFTNMFIATSDNLYITFRDYSNRFQYISFKRNDQLYLNDIKNKNCTQIINVPQWYPTNTLFLKPYLYYQSLPKFF